MQCNQKGKILYYTSIYEKKSGVAIWLRDTVHLREKRATRDIEGHHKNEVT